MNNYEIIIGVEVHAQLNTKHKIFSPSLVSATAKPNTNIHPIDLGMPGALPRFNEEVLKKAIIICEAFNMEITKKMHWDRKHYFYLDNPKGYQITQKETPIGKNGYIELDSGKKIKIEFMHMEEDTAKSFHTENKTLLDFNRCGTPLVEIVSAPEIRTPKEAREYLEKLKEILFFLNVSDCKMEEGSMRVDVNVSVRPYGMKEFNPKVEIKNLNSFKNVEIAIEKEVEKQIKAYNIGQPVLQATKRFNEQKNDLDIMRIKESSVDYRYFPEPDLPFIELTDDYIEELIEKMPLTPNVYREELKKIKFNEKEIKTLMNDKTMLEFFFLAYKKGLNPKNMFNYLTVNINEYLNKNKKELKDFNLSIDDFILLEKKLNNGEISSKHLKVIFPEMLDTGKNIETIIEEKNLKQISDPKEIEKFIEKVLTDFPEQLNEYKNGKTALFKFFLGKIMSESKGQINPMMTNKILQEYLDKKVNE